MVSEKLLPKNKEKNTAEEKVVKPKVLSLTQLINKKYSFLPNLPEKITNSFGKMTNNFIMLLWGDSGNGKTNMLIDLLKALMPHGVILYVSLEEGHEATMQMTAVQHLGEEHVGRIRFADDSMTYDNLMKWLKKKKSEQFIVIDSVQYWDLTLPKYKALKNRFKKKTFIFISHAEGKNPEGFLATKIKFDATYKIHVINFVAFVRSRLGGSKPYLIWEEGAKEKWGELQFNKIFKIKKEKKETAKKTKTKNEKATTNVTELSGGSDDSIQRGNETSTDRPSEIGAVGESSSSDERKSPGDL